MLVWMLWGGICLRNENRDIHTKKEWGGRYGWMMLILTNFGGGLGSVL